MKVYFKTISYTISALTFLGLSTVSLTAQQMTEEEFGLVYLYEVTNKPRAASRYFENIEYAMLRTQTFQALTPEYHSQFNVRIPTESEVFKRAVESSARGDLSDAFDFLSNPSVAVGVPIAPGTVLGYNISLNAPIFSDETFIDQTSERIGKIREFLILNPEIAKIASEHAVALLGHPLDIERGEDHYAVAQARTLLLMPDEALSNGLQQLDDLKTVSVQQQQIVAQLIEGQNLARDLAQREAELQSQRQRLTSGIVIFSFVARQLGNDTELASINYLLSGLQPLVSRAFERELLPNPSALGDLALAIQIFEVFQAAATISSGNPTIEQLILLEIQRLRIEMNQRFDVVERILGEGFSDVLRGQRTIKVSLAEIQNSLDRTRSEILELRQEVISAVRDQVLIDLDESWARCLRLNVGVRNDPDEQEIDDCVALFSRLVRVASSDGQDLDSPLRNRLYPDVLEEVLSGGDNVFGEWKLELWFQAADALVNFVIEYGNRQQLAEAITLVDTSKNLLQSDIASQRLWASDPVVPEETSIFLDSSCSSQQPPSVCENRPSTNDGQPSPIISIEYFTFLNSLYRYYDIVDKLIENQTISEINPWNILEDFDRPIPITDKIFYCADGFDRQEFSLAGITFNRLSPDRISWQQRDATGALSRQGPFDPTDRNLHREFGFQPPSGWEENLRNLPDEAIRQLWSIARLSDDKVGRLTLCYSFYQYNSTGSWEVRRVGSPSIPAQITTQYDLILHVGFEFVHQAGRTADLITYNVPLMQLSKRYSVRPTPRNGVETINMERGADRFTPMALVAIDQGKNVRSTSANGRHDSLFNPFFEAKPLNEWSGDGISVTYTEAVEDDGSPMSILRGLLQDKVVSERNRVTSAVLENQLVIEQRQTVIDDFESYSDTVFSISGSQIDELTARFIYRLPTTQQLQFGVGRERYGFDHMLSVFQSGGYNDSNFTRQFAVLSETLVEAQELNEASRFKWFLRSMGWD